MVTNKGQVQSLPGLWAVYTAEPRESPSPQPNSRVEGVVTVCGIYSTETRFTQSSHYKNGPVWQPGIIPSPQEVGIY